MDKEHNTERRVIAAFDFDGTLTTRDSLLGFLLFETSPLSLMRSVAKSSFFLLSYALKLIPNDQAKQNLFGNFYRNMSLADFDQRCLRFSRELAAIERPEALAALKWHVEQGHTVVIISASLENWIRPWAEKQGVQHVLATSAEVIDGRLTGRFLSRNCHGTEKVQRLRRLFPDRDAYELYAYGDSKSGDGPLLADADHPYFRCFS